MANSNIDPNDIAIFDPKYPGIDKETLAAAEELARREMHDNYMQIDFKYVKIIVPYLDGVEIMKHLKDAELVSNSISWDYLNIIPMNSESIQTSLVSREDYIEWKMRTLLKITEKPKDPF